MAYLLYHGMMLGLLAASCWSAGIALSPVLGRRPGLGDLRLLARFCLGLAALTLIVFLLSATGLLRSRLLWALMALLLAGALVHLTRRGRGAWPVRGMPGLEALVYLALLLALLTPFFLLAVTPAVTGDAGVYHLTLPKLFLAHQGFRPVPLNVYSTWPLGVELLFAVAMAIADYVLAKLVHFGFGLLTLYALYAGCRAHHRPESGWLAMIFFLANGVVGFELRVAYVDLAYAFYFLAAFLFMLQARTDSPAAGTALTLSGLCCGLMAGVKVTGIVGAAVIGALFLPHLVSAWRRGNARPVLTSFLTRFCLPVTILWTPWLARAAWLTGNPFYPFFHDLLGGPDWSSSLTGQLQAWQSSIGMGRTPVDYLLLPVRVILAGGRGYERFDGEIGAFWIVLLPLAAWAAWRVPLVRTCLGASGLYFLFWSLSSQQMRFLIPVLPLLAIAGAVAVVELVGRLPSARGRRLARVLGVVAAATFLVVTQGRELAAGYRTFGVYLRAEGDLLTTAGHPVHAFVNRSLPEDAKLLLLNTNQAFFFDREILADSFFEASQIAEWLRPAASVAQLRKLLDGRGVSHLLIEHRPLPIGYPPVLGELLRDPDHVEQIHLSEDRRFSVFALKPGEAE
ncbi:MAG: hypothetical protein GY719_12255 [bacterium]|nr:hypothetical protein [bacterium]